MCYTQFLDNLGIEYNMKKQKNKKISEVDTIGNELSVIVREAFFGCGYGVDGICVVKSKESELADYQSNGAFLVAKNEKMSPVEVAEAVALKLQGNGAFRDVRVVKPGFINLILSDEYLVSKVSGLFNGQVLGDFHDKNPLKVVLDFGGANIAKPLHVGHLRSAIIGDSIKRIGRYLGHEVIGDVHLGDWGLQMGMVITELARRKPELPYFDTEFKGEYPSESPVTMDELDELYPTASKNAKEDEVLMEGAKKATVELQAGRVGYMALWRHIVRVSVADLKEGYGRLGVSFDLWFGESDVRGLLPGMMSELKERGVALESDGALIMEVVELEDKKEIPPLMLYNSDKAVLYGGTDLATIKKRVDENKPDVICYVVDQRQSLAFEQVFRGARKAGIVDEGVLLEYVGFGTMNGDDGKPFKTRAGGVMKLRDLTEMIVLKARERVASVEREKGFSEEEEALISEQVAIATLKFADLSNYRLRNYVFDLDRFSAFEGSTGPYLQYSVVRAGSILKKAKESLFLSRELMEPKSEAERDLMLGMLEFRQVVSDAWEGKSPNLISNFAIDLATRFNRFYHESFIVSEEDERKRGSWLALVLMTKEMLTQSLDLLGIEVPERM